MLLSCRVGIELGAPTLDGGFPAPPFRLRSGFTVPPWPRFPRPPCDPGWSDFPNPVLTLAVAHKTFPIAAEFKCSVHVQSATPPVCFVGWFTCEDRFTPGSVSENHPGTAKCPEPLCLKTVFRLSERCLSCISSEGVAPPSSLLRAHAPDLLPSPTSGLTSCR